MGDPDAPTPAPFAFGIDVSHHQGAVDWNTVSNAGILFAFAKATEGATHVDPQFASNWRAMKDAGVTRGAYHFFRPATPVQGQVDAFLAAVGSLESGDLPAVLDLEEAFTIPGKDEWTDVATEQRVPLVMSWLEAVDAQLGLKPVIYTRRGFVTAFLGDPGPLTNYPLWIAHYTQAAQPSVPAGWASWTFWQYSEKGEIAGVQGAVDLDKFNGSPDGLQALTKG